jgi:hypothetical protein
MYHKLGISTYVHTSNYQHISVPVHHVWFGEHWTRDRCRCYDYLNIFGEKIVGFLLKTKLHYEKFWSWNLISRKTPIFWRKLAKIAKISDHNIDPRSAHPSELWVSVTKDVLTLVAKQTPLQNVNTARIRLRIFSKTFFSRADCCRTDQSSFTAGAEAHAIDICASFISGSSST